MHKKATPLPAGQLTILCIVLLTESVCSTMMIPFVGLYVAFMQGWAKESAGYSSGFLIGLFMLGQVLSSKLFGIMSDKYGRKICIGVGVFFCAVSMFLFGLSPNVWFACLWRFVHGCFAGCSLVAKTMISDVTDKTNQAKGFALVSLTWGVGTLFGPAIGGFLYDPVHKSMLSSMHLSESGFFAHYPAFLPSMVAGMYNFFAVFVCVCFLRETNKQARPLFMLFSTSVASKIKPFLNIIQPKLPSSGEITLINNENTNKSSSSFSSDKSKHFQQQHQNVNDDKNAFVVVDNNISINNKDASRLEKTDELFNKTCKNQTRNMTTSEAVRMSNKNQLTSMTHGTEESCNEIAVKSINSDKCKLAHELIKENAFVKQSHQEQKHISFGFKQAFQIPLLRNFCIVSMLISASDMLYAETFALWGIVSVQSGGLGLDSYQVGVLILVNSFPAVIGNIYFSKVLHIFNDELKYWRVCQCMYALLDVVIPVAPYFGFTIGFWYTMFCGIVRKVWETWTFCILMMMVAQTAPSGKVGVMYGVQQGTACMVRCVVPFIGAPLFAWSVSGHNVFPFNHFFLFILSAIPLFFSFGLTYRLHIVDEEEQERNDLQVENTMQLSHQEEEEEEYEQHQVEQSKGHNLVIGGRSEDNTFTSVNKKNAMNNDEYDSNLPQYNGILSTNASFGNMSRLALMRAKDGSFVVHEPSLPLNNSFVTLANSFATNLVPGLLQHTIVPPDLDLIMSANEDDSEADFDSACESVHYDQPEDVNNANCTMRVCHSGTSAVYVSQDLCERGTLTNLENSNNIQKSTHYDVDEQQKVHCKEDERDDIDEELPTI